MTKLTITFSNGRPSDIEIDGKIVPVDSFILLTNVPTEPPAGHVLAFGNSQKIGQLLFNFYANTVKHDPLGAHVIEMVCKDVISQATKQAGWREWMEDADKGVTN